MNAITLNKNNRDTRVWKSPAVIDFCLTVYLQDVFECCWTMQHSLVSLDGGAVQKQELMSLYAQSMMNTQ